MNNVSFALGFWHGYRGQRLSPTMCDDATAYSRGYEDGAIAASMALSDHRQLLKRRKTQ